MKLVALLLATVMSGQAPQFAGIWTGTFEGRPFVVLHLAEQAGTISGSIHHSTQINTSKDGTLLGVSGSFVDESIADVKIVGNELRFSTQDEDNEDTKYILHLSGPETAELSFADAPVSEVAPKPWMLHRGEQPQTELRRKR